MAKFFKYRFSGLGLIVLFLFVIELLARNHVIDPLFTPPPTRVVEALFKAVLTGELFTQMGLTLTRACIGYLLAMLIAVPIGVLMGEFRPAFNLLDATVEVLRPMPSSAIIPVAILLLGIGNEMRISVVVFGALWPTIVSTVDSVRRVDTVLIDTGRTLNLTRLQVITQIVVPAAAPGIATGMRISLAIALILALTVEMIAGGAGLGYYIIDAERSFKFADMYAGIIGAGILGYFVNRVFVIIEHWLLGWHYGLTARER